MIKIGVVADYGSFIVHMLHTNSWCHNWQHTKKYQIRRLDTAYKSYNPMILYCIVLYTHCKFIVFNHNLLTPILIICENSNN